MFIIFLVNNDSGTTCDVGLSGANNHFSLSVRVNTLEKLPNSGI